MAIMELEHRAKRRKITSLVEGHGSVKPVPGKARSKPAARSDEFLKYAARWNLEQDYENQPRKLKGNAKAKKRLPIKTEDGLIEHVEQPADRNSDSDSFLDSDSNNPDEAAQPGDGQAETLSYKQEILQAQEELARIADLMNQDPEEHIGGLKTLAQFSQSANLVVKKLSLVTQLAVFKDIIPSYRIKPRGEESLQERLSKEVRRLRTFEQGLVSSYQVYVQTLAASSRPPPNASSEVVKVSKVALSCLCQLLLAVPHFNFRSELLKPLVSRLGARRSNESFKKVVATIEQLFREDEDGNASRETVGMLAQLIKAKDYDVDESVVNTFLHLRLLTELSVKGSKDGVDTDTRPGERKSTKQQKKADYINKKQRKARRELKQLEKEFAETDATVQHEEREQAQAETLKVVFGVYFRILKTRSPKLMGAVLEGLARYAHLVNQDFFGDLLVTLQELADQALAGRDDAESGEDDGDGDNVLALNYASKANALRSALLCATTAFALLSSQDAATLNLDLSSFAALLYRLLLPLSVSLDLELAPTAARRASAHATGPASKVNATALATLLVRSLSSALAPRSTPPNRLAAFVHRLLLSALHTPEKTTTALVALAARIARDHGRKVRGIWSTEEQRGDGRFNPLGDIESCRPFCGTVWEGELLRLHFASGVRKGVGELEALVKGLDKH